MLGETLLPGGVAHGEDQAYDLYWAETEARSLDEKLLFADVLRVRPAYCDPRSLGLLGGHDVVAWLYILTTRMKVSETAALLRSALAACPDVLAGVSELPNGCGVAVRLLGSATQAVKVAFRTAWNSARTALLGVPAPHLLKR
jgi:urease accessory protein